MHKYPEQCKHDLRSSQDILRDLCAQHFGAGMESIRSFSDISILKEMVEKELNHPAIL